MVPNVIKRGNLVCSIISRFLTLTSAGQRGKSTGMKRKRVIMKTPSDNEESDNEEPRINDVLDGLSQLISRRKAYDLLQSMAASKEGKSEKKSSKKHFRYLPGRAADSKETGRRCT